MSNETIDFTTAAHLAAEKTVQRPAKWGVLVRLAGTKRSVWLTPDGRTAINKIYAGFRTGEDAKEKAEATAKGVEEQNPGAVAKAARLDL